jgi:hypothetical protein
MARLRDPNWVFDLLLGFDEHDPALEIEVPSAHCHDGIIEEVLMRHHPLSYRIKLENSSVIEGVNVGEELLSDGYHWKMLNIWIVFHCIRCNVMHVVASLPPLCSYSKQCTTTNCK